jgi:putative chitinase
MIITLDHIRKIARNKLDARALVNAKSVLLALEKHGPKFGLTQPHRLVQFLAQVMHESGEFRYDRELWGPTPAQKRYDTRTDLGNTAAADGDGKTYMGRTAMQITGKANTREFRDWCRKHISKDAPDFVAHPDLMNTDPWEGLGPLWYWDTRKLNRLADQGDVENITEKINGGLNGYADRVTILGRASLVLLGYGPDDMSKFQRDYKVQLVDGKPGPKTRSALHVALVKLTEGAMAKPTVTAAPVVEEVEVIKEVLQEVEVPVPVAVTPPALDKPLTQTTGFWERITSIFGVIGLGSASWLGDWKVILALTGALVILALLGLVMHTRIVTAVKSIKDAIGG